MSHLDNVKAQRGHFVQGSDDICKKKPTESSVVPLYTPVILAAVSGIRLSRTGFRKACGAGMMRGSTQSNDAVIGCACSMMEVSPMTTSRLTTSSDHSVLTGGNHFQSDIVSKHQECMKAQMKLIPGQAKGK
jgi:hypothetical protein